jgi:predicted kinase
MKIESAKENIDITSNPGNVTVLNAYKQRRKRHKPYRNLSKIFSLADVMVMDP